MGLLLCGLNLADLTPRHHTNIFADIPERHLIKPAGMQPRGKGIDHHSGNRHVIRTKMNRALDDDYGCLRRINTDMGKDRLIEILAPLDEITMRISTSSSAMASTAEDLYRQQPRHTSRR